MVQGVDQDNVTEWLVNNIGDVVAPFEFTLIAGGHSNLTFRAVDARGRSLVLRRPPLGHVLESAHDMAREHRIISALGDSAVPVAPALGLCRDVEVNEAPFYIMEFVDGPVLHNREAAASLTAEERVSTSESVADVLAALHDINPDDVGLGDLGRKEAYLERQMKRWNKQWQASKTDEIPEMERASELLQQQLPKQIGASIVHGDYRLGNMIVTQGRLAAVLDWELCTLGDPLADVGYVLNNWVQPDDEGAELADVPTAEGGFLTRDEICERYQSATGRDLTDINYYRAFSHWRLAAIGQGVYKRYLVGAMGDTHDMDLDVYKQSVVNRAIAALELLER